MAVKIRLARTGKKKHPSYRLVVADARMPRDGRFIEVIGHYHPADGGGLNIKEDRAHLWLSRGAQPTQKVKDLFKRSGILKKFQMEECREVVE